MEPIIEVRNLTKVFKSRGRKITAVDDVSFDVANGEIFSMIGPNGAGKSTTFAMMTTLIKPTSGKIKVAGFDAEIEDDRIRPIIGIVPQKLSLTLTLQPGRTWSLWATFMMYLKRSWKKGSSTT